MLFLLRQYVGGGQVNNRSLPLCGSPSNVKRNKLLLLCLRRAFVANKTSDRNDSARRSEWLTEPGGAEKGLGPRRVLLGFPACPFALLPVCPATSLGGFSFFW